MELHCDSKKTTSNTQDHETLKVNAEEFQPKRSTAVVAEQRIIDIADISERYLIGIIKWRQNNLKISRSRTN